MVDSKPRLVLSGGSRCKSTPDGPSLDLKASTIVEFTCDASIFGPGQPRLLGQLPPGDDEIACSYFIEWKTHVSHSVPLRAVSNLLSNPSLHALPAKKEEYGASSP